MSGHRSLLIIAVLVAVTAGAAEIESTTRVHQNGVIYLVLGASVVWSFVLAGLVAWRRRPGNDTGPLMVVLGFAWAAAVLGDSANDALFTAGLVLGSLWIPILIHLLMAYPSGRLDGRSRMIVVAAYLALVVPSLLVLPFTQPRLEGGGVSRESASNLLLVTYQPAFLTVLKWTSLVVALAIVAIGFFTLWRRWATATGAERRVLAPVYVTGAIAMAVLILVVLGFDLTGHASSPIPFYAFTIAFTAIPLGYLLGVLRTRFDRSLAVETLVATLRNQNEPGGVRDALRLALNDQTLDLAYRRAGSDEYLSVNGEPYRLPSPSDHRAVTPIEHDGAVVAALVHDPFLLDDRDLIDAVCAAAGLSLANERLQADLRAQIQEVGASQRRLQDVLENVQLLAVSIDQDGRIRFCNQHLADVTGWTREELLGAVWLERFPGGDEDFLDRIREDRILVHDETMLITKSGERREISWSNTVTRDAKGHIVGATSIGQDVTDRNRAEQGLRDLAAEQAALRRVATLVATAGDPQQVFQLATKEVTRILNAQTGNLIRFDETLDGGTVVGAWSEPGAGSVDVGSHVVFDGPTAVGQVLASGRPARIDDYSTVQGQLAQRLRDLGLRASVAAPITVAGRLWGAITVSTGAQAFPPGVEIRIGEFTDLVAVAIAGADARAELGASRARIVAAGDAERRRLERNLHDGAQQRLVSLSLALRMAQSHLDPAGNAAQMLVAANVELARALEELRELARGIHPAILTDRGLAPALHALGDRAPLPVSLRITTSTQLPPHIEASIYYLIAEALTNIVKHASASRVDVTVSQTTSRIDVDVSDDGRGGADPAGGTGLRGLADRVEALNGRLRLTSLPGEGTTLRAEIPIGTTVSELFA